MDDAGFLIRHAVPQDAEDARRVLVETWHDTYDLLLGSEKVAEITDRWHAVEVLTQQIGSPDGFFLVAGRSGRLIGHAFARMPQPGVLFLSRLHVLPAWQRRGVGTRMLEAVLEQHPGAAQMRLSVEAGNRNGAAFYHRHGFTVNPTTQLRAEPTHVQGKASGQGARRHGSRPLQATSPQQSTSVCRNPVPARSRTLPTTTNANPPETATINLCY